VCMLLGASTDCLSSYHNMRGREVPYKQNHSCGTVFYVGVGEGLKKLPTVLTKVGPGKSDARSHHHSSLVPPVQKDIEPERSQHPHNLVGRFGNLSSLQSRPQLRRLRDPLRCRPLWKGAVLSHSLVGEGVKQRWCARLCICPQEKR
jgi:hypothetical protein